MLRPIQSPPAYESIIAEIGADEEAVASQLASHEMNAGGACDAFERTYEEPKWLPGEPSTIRPNGAVRKHFVVDRLRNGDRYIGEVNGMSSDWCGYGVLIGANGDRYVGGFATNLRHGWGVQTYGDDGHSLEGGFLSGDLPVRGTIRYANGAIYEGHLRDGKPFGFGTKTFQSSHATYRGRFCEKGFCGPGELTVPGSKPKQLNLCQHKHDTDNDTSKR